jgi:YVTN family beta-propeller protein
MRFNRRKRNFVTFKVVCAFWALAVAVWNARPAEASPFAYVTDETGVVSVIDTAINEVVAAIPTEVRFAPSAAAVAADGKRVYVTLNATHPDTGAKILVLGAVNNTVVATVVVGSRFQRLRRVAVAADGKRAYVVGSVANANNFVVLVLDIATEEIVAQIEEQLSGGACGGIAITRDDKRLYVACSGKVFVFDTTRNAFIATVPLLNDGNLSGVAITPDQKHVYVTGDSKAWVLETARNTVEATVSLNTTLSGVAITPDGKRAYVIGISGTISVLDTTDNRVIATISARGRLSGIAITPDGKRAYVSGGSIWVIDTATNTVVDTLTVTNANDVAMMPPPDGNVRVMTQNMNVGPLGTLRMGMGTPEAAAQFFTETVATYPKDRAAAIAKEIHANQPDLIALQEVGILRKGSLPTPNDPNIPATEVVHDQLQLLRDELAKLGEHYDTVAIIPNSDVQFPSTLNFVVRLTDRTVILAQASSNRLKLSNVHVEQFFRQPVLSSQLAGRFGWGSVDVEVGDRKFRFVTTHLTPAPPPVPPPPPDQLPLIAIQQAQASELIQSAGKPDLPGESVLPIVYVGDFNTVAGLGTYKILVDNSGRIDAWLTKNPTTLCPEPHPAGDRRGCTCCQKPPLNNSMSELDHRVDLVIVPRGVGIEDAKLVGDDPNDQTHTSPRLWPSDHAGLVVSFRFLNPP